MRVPYARNIRYARVTARDAAHAALRDYDDVRSGAKSAARCGVRHRCVVVYIAAAVAFIDAHIFPILCSYIR